jgi:FixJ family two-component response regulator
VTPQILVVDDDAAVCVALSRLLRAAGYRVQTFASASDVLDSGQLADADCLVLDINLPDFSGLELQTRLVSLGVKPRIVFITGYGDIPTSVRAMKAGALEFLPKPFDDDVLLHAIDEAIARARQAREDAEAIADLRSRYRSLTPRERQVFALVVRGLLNKQIAGELGTAEKTVKIQRGQMMRKMEAGSVPDLVRMAAKLSVDTAESPIVT